MSSVEQQVLEYFRDRHVHMAPSQIDWVMALPRGTAHDIIIKHWASEWESQTGRVRDYTHEQL